MIYFIGGAPRSGKSLLGQRLSATRSVGWVSTDLLMELLRVANAAGRKMKWDATPEAIRAHAEWFFPYLERFVWGVSSLADHYVIEGVDFLPAQVAQLSTRYPIRAVFLGCSRLTLEGIIAVYPRHTAVRLLRTFRAGARSFTKKPTVSGMGMSI